MEVSKLVGEQLDYWVAKATGREMAMRSTGLYVRFLEGGPTDWRLFKPSTDWNTGGPIIEQEFMELTNDRDWREDGNFGRVWQANDAGAGYWDGDTPLIAAMRAFVALKFGKEVPSR